MNCVNLLTQDTTLVVYDTNARSDAAEGLAAAGWLHSLLPGHQNDGKVCGMVAATDHTLVVVSPASHSGERESNLSDTGKFGMIRLCGAILD